MAFENAFYISGGVFMTLLILLYITFKIGESNKSFWLDVFKLLMIGVSISMLLLIPYSFLAYESDYTTVINYSEEVNNVTIYYYYSHLDMTDDQPINDIFYNSYTWFVRIFVSLLVSYIFYTMAVYFGWIKRK